METVKLISFFKKTYSHEISEKEKTVSRLSNLKAGRA